MKFALEVLVEPTVEPISLEEAKAHLRVDSNADDDLIASLISAVRGKLEIWLRRSLVTRTLRATCDHFPMCDWLMPRPPLIAVTSIVYIDAAGDSQTLGVDRYQVDNRSEPGRIRPEFGMAWPATQERFNAVSVTYTAGYGPAGSDVPAAIRAAMKLGIGGLFEHREDSVPQQIFETRAVDSLLWPFRNFRME